MLMPSLGENVLDFEIGLQSLHLVVFVARGKFQFAQDVP